MPETLLIADLHLDACRPEQIEAARWFFDHRGRQAEAIYILGDFFEYWIGDDDTRPEFETLFSAIADTTARQCPIYFQDGNRDFLVGDTLCRQLGIHRLAEIETIDLYGTPTALLHGDTLCTDDQEYQTLRQQLRNPIWQQQFLSLPVTERRHQAEKLRAQSLEAVQNKSETIMDVHPVAVNELLAKTGAQQIIHGHTHRRAIHKEHDTNGRSYRRIVLGDWYSQPSFLSITPHTAQFESLPFITS